MFIALLKTMVIEEETLKLVEDMNMFKDYRNRMLIAILGFFANLMCFPKFVESIYSCNPKGILDLFCLCLV